MFVRVVRDGHTSTYECDDVHFRPHNEEDHVLINLERNPKRGQDLVVDKRTSEVYLMNDQGQTIDTYTWGYD